MTEQPTTPAVQATAPPPAAPAATSPSNAAKEERRDPKHEQNIKSGMGYWNTALFISGLASDVATPIAKWSIPIFILFALATATAGYFAFAHKRKHPLASQAVGTLGLGTAVFGVLVAGQLLTPGGLGKERGIIASFVPPVAAVQTAVLPLSPLQKDLLTLSTDINTGDPEARSAAARAALTDAKQPAPERRAKLERILHNADPNVQQAGLVSAMHDRGRGPIPVLPDRSSKSPLMATLAGSQIEFYGVNEQTGAVGGVFHASGAARGFSGSVANGRLVITTEYLLDSKWKAGLVIDASVDSRLQLTGEAKTPEGDAVKVELPIL